MELGSQNSLVQFWSLVGVITLPETKSKSTPKSRLSQKEAAVDGRNPAPPGMYEAL